MALSARLQLRQTQSLVITPQLMQAIRLLQMSGLELERYLAAELEQNPLLEQDEGAGAAAADGGDAPDEPAPSAFSDSGFAGLKNTAADAGRPLSGGRAGQRADGFDDLSLENVLPAKE